MSCRPWFPSIAAAVLVAACAAPGAPDARSVLSRADQAMGGSTLKSIRFTTSGTGATFGQAFQPGMAWPRLNYSVLTRWADYENAALREDYGRSRAEPQGGGATPLMGQGEQRVTALLRGDFAWNLAGANAAPAPVERDERVHDLWTTPHGIVKAGLRNASAASVRALDGGSGHAVSFTEPGSFDATVFVGADGLVQRIESRRPHPVSGDTEVATAFSEYRDHGGVKFPMRIRQDQAGYPVLDLAVQDVQPHAGGDVVVPDAVRNFAERVSADKVADGVWFLAGGSHNSVLIEARDHLLLVEAPLYDGRTLAVIAKAKELVPGKPVRHVVTSHHHFDHAGGLRAAASEGATLVTSAMAKPYFESVLANPNRIAPDALARSGRAVSIVGVDGKLALGDADRVIEVHEMQGSIHAFGFLMVWLPKERLLIQADAYTPGPPGAPPPPVPVPNANNVNLVANIERLKLDVDRILPLHSRVVPIAELYTAIGRSR